MKKSLLAVAAIGAFASAAQAQSNVTIYGIMDMGYVNKNIKGSPASATNTQTANSFSASSESSSRLGFKGSEDLGGGSSAFFTMEIGLTPADQVASQVNNRQSFVGYKKNGAGQFALGTQYTPMFNSVAATDPGMGNNVLGSVIYPQGGTAGSQASADSALTLRMNNSLTVKTDKFAGFTVGGMYALKNTNSYQSGNTVGGTLNSSMWGVNADYTWNKLYATVAAQTLKSESDAGGTTATFADKASVSLNASSGLILTPAFTGTNTTDNQQYAGATYDFGILKAYAGWTNRKIASNFDNNLFLKRQGQQIGVRSYITPKIEAWALAGNGRYTAASLATPSLSSGAPTANFTAYQLGANYYLSKRTNFYGIFGSTQTSSTSAGSLNGNSTAVGIRHTF